MNEPTAPDDETSHPPKAGKVAKISRAALQIAGGAVPLAGGLLSAIAGAWSEGEQDRFNRFFEQWLEMVKDELKEKEQTVFEIMARLDLQDEKIAKRVETKEFQSLLKKAFREWAGTESEIKREYVRNILANAAASQISSDVWCVYISIGSRTIRSCTFGSLVPFITVMGSPEERSGPRSEKAPFERTLPMPICTSF
jgi:hypothetical protein